METTKKKVAGVRLEPNYVWASCCKTWLKKMKRYLLLREKKSKYFPGSGFVPTHVWAPCCERILKPEVGCHVVSGTFELSLVGHLVIHSLAFILGALGL